MEINKIYYSAFFDGEILHGCDSVPIYEDTYEEAMSWASICYRPDKNGMIKYNGRPGPVLIGLMEIKKIKVILVE